MELVYSFLKSRSAFFEYHLVCDSSELGAEWVELLFNNGSDIGVELMNNLIGGKIKYDYGVFNNFVEFDGRSIL